MRRRLNRRLVRRFAISMSTATAITVAVAVGAAGAGLSTLDPCMPQNQQFSAGYADMTGGGYSYKCWLIGQHGNFGSVAYTNVYYNFHQNVTVPCDYVGARVTYAYNGNLYNGTRSNATYHQWASSTAPGSNRLIVGSSFFATRVGYYDYANSTGAIGC